MTTPFPISGVSQFSYQDILNDPAKAYDRAQNPLACPYFKQVWPDGVCPDSTGCVLGTDCDTVPCAKPTTCAEPIMPGFYEKTPGGLPMFEPDKNKRGTFNKESVCKMSEKKKCR